MFIVHCSCSLFIVPTVLLSSLMMFLSITRRGTDDSCDDIALSKSYTEYIFFMSHF